MKNGDHSWLKNVAVVLVEPQHPGNIASVARAMVVNGLQDLRIIRSDEGGDPENEPWWLAWGAEGLLRSATTWKDLESCLSDHVFVVACARRKRRHSGIILSPREAAQRLAGEASSGVVSLVFGSERTGLHAHHLELCHLRSVIPQMVDYPSYNLSHAVSIYAYELTLIRGPVKHPTVSEAPTVASLQALRRHLDSVLSLLGPCPDRLGRDIYRLWLRAQPNERELKLLHKLLQLTRKRVSGMPGEYAMEEKDTNRTVETRIEVE